MLDQAIRKLWLATRALPGPPELDAFTYDVIDHQDALRDKLAPRGQIHMLTAQRVLLNCRIDKRVALLQHRAQMLTPGGSIIVDIPHPARDGGAVLVGPRPVNLNASTVTMLGAFQGAENQAFEECRQYARDIASDIVLIITNAMPAQLPPGCIDCQSGFDLWFRVIR